MSANNSDSLTQHRYLANQTFSATSPSWDGHTLSGYRPESISSTKSDVNAEWDHGAEGDCLRRAKAPIQKSCAHLVLQRHFVIMRIRGLSAVMAGSGGGLMSSSPSGPVQLH